MFLNNEKKNVDVNALPDSIGHIRCLGVVPVEIEDLLREIQLELDSE